MNLSQPELLPDENVPAVEFVRFDALEAFYARLKAEGRRCISQSLDRKRHGYECVVVDAGAGGGGGMIFKTAASEHRSHSH